MAQIVHETFQVNEISKSKFYVSASPADDRDMKQEYRSKIKAYTCECIVLCSCFPMRNVHIFANYLAPGVYLFTRFTAVKCKKIHFVMLWIPFQLLLIFFPSRIAYGGDALFDWVNLLRPQVKLLTLLLFVWLNKFVIQSNVFVNVRQWLGIPDDARHKPFDMAYFI